MQFCKFVLFAAACCFAAIVPSTAIAQSRDTLDRGPKLPILAWGSIPQDQATVERYQELAEAGFTHSFSGAGSEAAMRKMLDNGHQAGIKQFVASPELKTDPEGTARKFKNHPGIGGYYLRDEPGAKLFPELGAWAKRIQAVDNVNPCYVNLFPTYGSPAQWDTPDYQTHVDEFIKQVSTPMLSFDHYPVIRTGKDASTDRLRDDFYNNLEICSKAAKESGRPLWAFALSVAHDPYPIPTAAHLRVQAYSNLAYGTQVMQYFTYWTLKSDTWNFHQAPIDVDGSRTPTYDLVKAMNEELQAVRAAFVGSQVESVGHTGEKLPAGTVAYTPAAPIESVTTEGAGAVVSLLARDDEKFLVIVNRDIHRSMPTTIKLDATAGVKHVQKDGSLRTIEGAEVKAEAQPGDAIILTWKHRG